MKKARLRGLNDYLAMIVRRRFWVIGGIIAVSALAVLVSRRMPRLYVSETMILIQPRDVPTDFVKDLIAGSTDERLSAIEQTVLSRTNLLKVLVEFEDRMPGYRGLNDERKYLKLKDRIKIDFSSERRNGRYLPTTNFRISYRDQNPELAQKITDRLASLFIDQDGKAREAQVFGTREFLSGELNKVAEQLQQSENTLKNLKEKFRYELPTKLETNLRTLDRLQLQQNAAQEALDRYLTTQMTLERQISETPPMIFRENPGQAAAAAPVNPKVEIYRRKELEYKELLVKATPSHPDAQRLKEELEQLKKEIPPEDFAAMEARPTAAEAQAAVPNPVYQNLTAQLRQLKTEIEIREREKRSIADDMQRYNQHIQNTPRVEQDLLAATRANEDLLKQHEGLKAKLEQAKLAESLESQLKGSQFVVIDAANLPLEPVTPAQSAVIAIGFVISLFVGVAAAWAADSLHPRIWTQRELERWLGAPVMIEIPRMASPEDRARMRRTRLLQAAAFLAAMGAYVGGLYYLYARQASVLRLLDPIIDKIMQRMMS